MTEYIEMPTGLLLPDHVAEEIAIRSMRPKAVDLFAGAGGASCGLIQAGYEVVAALDNDPAAAATFMCNLGSYPCQFVFVDDVDRQRMEKCLAKSYKSTRRDQLTLPFTAGSGWISELDPKPPGCGVFFLGDVRKVKGRDILHAVGLDVGELDCVIGGPPCQGYSHAGKQNVMDPRNSLLFEFARLVLEMRPKAIVMENVPGLLHMTTPEGLPVIDAFCRVLQDGSFAGLDALKRSIARQGQVGLMAGKVPTKRAKKSKRPADTMPCNPGEEEGKLGD